MARKPKKPLRDVLRDSTTDELEEWSTDELTPIVNISSLGQRIDELTVGTVGLVVEVRNVKERLVDVEDQVRAGPPCQQAKQIERMLGHIDELREHDTETRTTIFDLRTRDDGRRERKWQGILALVSVLVVVFSSVGGVIWWARGASEAIVRVGQHAERNETAIAKVRDQLPTLKDEVRDHRHGLEDHGKRLTMVESVSESTKQAVDKLQPRPRRRRE